MSRFSETSIGYIAAVVQAVFYSTMGIFAKLLYACGLDAQLVMVTRFACALVFLGVFIALTHSKRTFLSRQPAVYAQSAFFFTSAWLYFVSAEYMNAGLVTVVFYTFPAVVAVMNVFFFRERLSWRIVASLVLSVAGIICISGVMTPDSGMIDIRGVAAAVGACFAFASYTVLIRKTARVEDSFTVTFNLSLISLIVSCVVFSGELPLIPQLVGVHEVLLASGLALFATILPIIIYIFAIARIGSTKASILSIAEAPSTLMLAYLILGETLNLWQMIGSLLIIVSIIVVTVGNAGGSESVSMVP